MTVVFVQLAYASVDPSTGLCCLSERERARERERERESSWTHTTVASVDSSFGSPTSILDCKHHVLLRQNLSGHPGSAAKV